MVEKEFVGGSALETMIPPKLLVYRRTHCDVNIETVHETWRRKKSCGDLFQNGYRVRPGHHGRRGNGSQSGFYHSVWSCFHVLSNWGKSISAGGLSVYKIMCLHVCHSNNKIISCVFNEDINTLICAGMCR